MIEEDKTISHLLQAGMTIAFGAWAWVVKTAASKHLDGIERIERRLESMANRVSILETKMDLYHGHKERITKDDR